MKEIITKYSNIYSLDPIIVACLIIQESNGDKNAIRFEKSFYKNKLELKKESELAGFIPKKIPTLDTEKIARATSWGLMQIMGETARSILKFEKQYLSELIDIETNISLGTKYLSQLIKKKDSYIYGLLLYNGGGNRDYPNMVLKHRTTGKYLELLN